MIKDLSNYLIGSAIGIRFRPNFTIEDQIGRITDTILYSKDSFFNPSVYPTVLKTQSGQRILINDSTNDRMTIDNSNIVLEISFGDDLKFEKDNLDDILNAFNNQIIKGILKDFTITEFVRIGYICRYLFNEEDLINSFINRTAGESLRDVKDMNLRFSKKIPLHESVAKKNVNDYENAIFNIIKRADRQDEIFMAIDYQRYFLPHLASSAQISFESFIKGANLFNESRFLPWLNSYYLEESDEK